MYLIQIFIRTLAASVIIYHNSSCYGLYGTKLFMLSRTNMYTMWGIGGTVQYWTSSLLHSTSILWDLYDAY